jgi:chromosomal replication initiation ATPase DnaA
LDELLARDVKFYLCRQYTSEKLKEIAADAKIHQKKERIAQDLGLS